MYVGRVTLRNVRGFSALDFNLHRPDGGYAGWTVFTGDNGSGKSTLLKAIALGLTGADTARTLQPSFRGWVREEANEEELVPNKHQEILSNSLLTNKSAGT